MDGFVIGGARAGMAAGAVAVGGIHGGQPPKKKRRTLPTLTITSGLRSDVVKFQWKIENFAAIRHSKTMLQAQQFVLDLGAPVGVPCKWHFTVASETEIVPAQPQQVAAGGQQQQQQPTGPKVVEWLEIIRKLVKVPEEGDEICNCCSIKIKDKDRKSVFKGYGTVNSLKLNGYRTFKKVLKLSDKSSELPLVDGALVIDFTVTTFANGPVTHLDTLTMTEFKGLAAEKLSTDLTNLLNGTGGGMGYSDIKIVSKDGKEFHAHKSILAGRNSVFQAMFASNLIELQSGVIHVEDLSGKVMDLLLKYIYGATLEENWFQNDTIVELTYAAGKYQLTEVLRLLDKILGTKGKGENAGVLLALAEKLGLKQAEKELVAYVKKEAVPAAESYQDLMAIFATNGNSFGLVP